MGPKAVQLGIVCKLAFGSFKTLLGMRLTGVYCTSVFCFRGREEGNIMQAKQSTLCAAEKVSITKRKTIGKFLVFGLGTAVVLVLCVCFGSVLVPLGDTAAAVWQGVFGLAPTNVQSYAIVTTVRLPRVLTAAFMGAALSLCGAAMQGLLKNPLADGSTLGVSSGASLGAVLSIAFSSTLPVLSGLGTTLTSMMFAFLSLLLILALAKRLDNSLSTNTIILLGIIFSMFMNSIISLIVTFAGDRVRSIVFWTMGSLSTSGWFDVAVLAVALLVAAPFLFYFANELNAFSISEENARHVGIHVEHVKLFVLVLVSMLIGVCVSIGGTIGFVGLFIPHVTRMLTGPNHRLLLPASALLGAAFLMLADLCARTLFSPRELPIGVVTSLVGAVWFLLVFYRTRRQTQC